MRAEIASEKLLVTERGIAGTSYFSTDFKKGARGKEGILNLTVFLCLLPKDTGHSEPRNKISPVYWRQILLF